MLQRDEHRRPTVVLLVDELHLRRAAIACFLKPWAEGVALPELEDIATIDQAAAPAREWAIIIVSVGSDRLTRERGEAGLRHVMAVAGDVPVVVLSDRQETTEMAKAFQAGVRGFLPTSTPPEVALKALTFILQGGHFFPPSVFQPAPERGQTPGPEKSNGGPGNPGAELRHIVQVALAGPESRHGASWRNARRSSNAGLRNHDAAPLPQAA